MSNHAVLYDYLMVQGGAEAVTLKIAKTLGYADIYVAFQDHELFADILPNEQHCTELTTATRFRALRIFKAIYAFQKRHSELRSYDKIVYSGLYAPLAIDSHPDGNNILYCHTIPRFAYDLEDYYLARATPVDKYLLRLLNQYLRPRYEAAIAQMDTLIVNSETVKKRLKTYLGHDAQVVYPPCQVNNFNWLGQDDYYLSLARLEDYKRVELIIEAFLQMPDKKLVVASGGSEYEKLRQLAQGANNIHFTGWLELNPLRQLIGRCIATLYIAKDEDFGLSPVESMAAGKPVIGVAEGGLLETLLPDITSILLPADLTTEHIMTAVCQLDGKRALTMRVDCEQQAHLFNEQTFEVSIRAAIS